MAGNGAASVLARLRSGCSIFTSRDIPSAQARIKERVAFYSKSAPKLAALFPNEASLLRLISAHLCGQSDEWLTSKIHLNMTPGHPSVA